MEGGGERLRRLAEAVVSRPRAVLAATFAFLVVAAVLGAGVADQLKVGGFDDPGSESSRAQQVLDDEFAGTSNLVLQVTGRTGDVDDAEVRAAAERLSADLTTEEELTLLDSYWSSGSDELRSEDGRSGLVLLHVGGTTEERDERAEEIVDGLPVDDPAIEVGAGGSLGLTNAINTRVDDDLVKSETIALPTTLILLILVFGGVVAGLLPVALGVVSIVATQLVLFGLSQLTDVSVYALMVATAFGLGLAIDFGLFMVSRFREERDAGHPPRQAVIEAVATAGETILFSASTVAIAMASMLVFPVYFLRSVGLAAIVVVVDGGGRRRRRAARPARPGGQSDRLARRVPRAQQRLIRVAVLAQHGRGGDAAAGADGAAGDRAHARSWPRRCCTPSSPRPTSAPCRPTRPHARSPPI